MRVVTSRDPALSICSLEGPIMRAASFLAAVICTASLGIATAAFAWGPEGHTVVARVGTSNLRPRASADLQWIISVGVPALNARVRQQYGMKCQIDAANPWGPVPSYETDQGQHTNLANWADCYRSLNPATAGWHFDNIPLGQTPSGPLNAGSQPWCAQPDSCLSEAFAANLRKLSTPGLAPADAAMALAFVVHFTGDMHQPLHDEDNGDHCGNQVSINTARSYVTAPDLHDLWDTPLVAVALGTQDLDDATQGLKTFVAESVQPPTYATVDKAIAVSDGWVGEAHKLALPAYSLLNIPVGAGPRSNVPVTSDYAEQESQVVYTQLVLAAVRLGAVLDVALTWSPPS
jgi:hypothetical protein